MDIKELKAGDHHYMAYVGPPAQYDFMGATQFRLLCALGLRAEHSVLEVGCGSLRAGRLFITYLAEGRYCGIEPNKWLIEEGVRHQIGEDVLRIKKPRFDYNSDFAADVFGERFDFVLAQSIFSHTGRELVTRALSNFRDTLTDRGIIAASFMEGRPDFAGEGWVYPECVQFRPKSIIEMGSEAGLVALAVPWYHPRLKWYLFAKKREFLPARSSFGHLSGAVLFDPGFRESWKRGPRLKRAIKTRLRYVIPIGTRDVARRVMKRFSRPRQS